MKNLKAKYKPGRRVGHMLKIKPEERDFDLVITGAEYGTGKRSGWMSSFILSCKKGNRYLEVGKSPKKNILMRIARDLKNFGEALRKERK